MSDAISLFEEVGSCDSAVSVLKTSSIEARENTRTGFGLGFGINAISYTHVATSLVC